ncbi:MAG: hypothetical protein WEB30_09580 [Cyclobacteriaceae bacterium]
MNDIIIQPVHAMAECTCASCHFQFYQIFPVGHHVADQLSFSKVDKTYYSKGETEPWLFDSLVKANEGVRQQDVTIEKIVYRNCEDVIILNTLDYLYGHVLLKLYNALYHLDHQKNLGLILIIPKMFKWLIPDGCAEAWVVDLKLADLAYNHESVRKFISLQFGRFNSIYLSRAYSHPDVATIDISRLTRIKPFDLATYRERKPTITFVMRQDRWWFGSVAEYWFYRMCRKLKLLSWGSRLLSRRQNHLVKQTMRRIGKKIPASDFYIVGLGEDGNFGSNCFDERKTQIDDGVETAWCKIYARSHVVVGVHGSNMLLPTALAAGCVEILPQERYGNMVQDISVRYNDRRQLFFYRFADQYSRPRSVAAKVVGMLHHYDIYHRNMCLNLYRT